MKTYLVLQTELDVHLHTVKDVGEAMRLIEAVGHKDLRLDSTPLLSSCDESARYYGTTEEGFDIMMTIHEVSDSQKEIVILHPDQDLDLRLSLESNSYLDLDLKLKTKKIPCPDCSFGWGMEEVCPTCNDFMYLTVKEARLPHPSL